MRLLFLFGLVICLTYHARGQHPTLDNKNYYAQFYQPGSGVKLKGKILTTKWLREYEVVPILLEELQNAGYEWVVSSRLYRLDTTRYVVLTAYSQKANLGFLYVEGHTMSPLPAHRQKRGIDLTFGHFDYQQVVTNTAGENGWMRIKKLPENILVLAEEWYWYQTTDNPADNQVLLTREDIVRVLRQDIREKLSAEPKSGKP